MVANAAESIEQELANLSIKVLYDSSKVLLLASLVFLHLKLSQIIAIFSFRRDLEGGVSKGNVPRTRALAVPVDLLAIILPLERGVLTYLRGRLYQTDS